MQLFRHCVRSVDTGGLKLFAAKPFPSFGVKADYCLPRGIQIYTGMGGHLRPLLHNPIVVGDSAAQRNIDSAHALASGLGLSPSRVIVNGSAFTHCTGPSSSIKQALETKRFHETLPPSNATALVTAVDRALGGKKKIAAEEDQIKDGSFEGKSVLAAKAAEVFMMQFGGGLQMGWGEVEPAEMYQMLQMQVSVLFAHGTAHVAHAHKHAYVHPAPARCTLPSG